MFRHRNQPEKPYLFLLTKNPYRPRHDDRVEHGGRQTARNTARNGLPDRDAR